MVMQVIFDDKTSDLIYSHMLQFGIEFGINGNKIIMFYRDSERTWITTSQDLLRSATSRSNYDGPERRSEAALASLAFNTASLATEPDHGSARRINAVNCYQTI